MQATLTQICGFLLFAFVESANIPQTEELCQDLSPPKNGNISCGHDGIDFVCKAHCLKGFEFKTKDVTVARACDAFAGTWYEGKEFPECTSQRIPDCLNGGCCVAAGKCACLEGWKGSHCEKPTGYCNTPTAPANGNIVCQETTFDLICNATCMPGFIFTNNETFVRKSCDLFDGTWFEGKDLLDCEPFCAPGCINGGTCVGGNRCACSPEWTGSHCQHIAADVMCKKLDTPAHGGINCSVSESHFSCNVTCDAGFLFKTGHASYVKTCNMSSGLWIDGGNIPDCEAEKDFCAPGCQNGGSCIAPNQCSCTAGWTGSHCQHGMIGKWSGLISMYRNLIDAHTSWSEQAKKAFCPTGILDTIECRTFGLVPYNATGEYSHCTIANGLYCSDQMSYPKKCSDYEVRYHCSD